MVYYPEDKMIHRLSFLARFWFNKPDISRHDIPSFVLFFVHDIIDVLAERFWNDFSPGLKRLTYREDALSLIFCESDDKTVRLSNTFYSW